jgi:two-component system, chemotaxis family, response regulator Rcp1
MAEILLIEDNPGDVLLTIEAFKECGHEHKIASVKDGIEAMRYLKRQDEFGDASIPDMIMLDLNLPRKDGREVLAEIKNDEELSTIPVIILSTSKNEIDINKCYELHANCYITKPVELDRFIEIIMSVEKYWMHKAQLPKTTKQLI